MGYQNFFATKLYTDIGASDTTITLDQAPTETSGRLVLEARNPTQREIIKYSGVSGNQITGVLRGQGDTTAKTHVKGSLVEMNVTAEDLDDALGVPNDVVTRFDESLADFVASGMVWSQTSGLNGAMTSGVVYINGNRLPISAIVSYAFPASKDIYVDVDVAGTIIYTPVANGAVSGFTLGANSVRLAKIVTNGSAITSVTQFGYDALNTVIYPNGSVGGNQMDSSDLSLNMKIAYNTSASSPTATGETNLSGVGLTLSFTVAKTCKAMIDVSIGCSSTSDFEFHPRVYLDGAQVAELSPVAAPGAAGNRAQQRTARAVVTLTPGVHTMTGRIFLSSSTSPSIPIGGAFISAIVLGKVTA